MLNDVESVGAVQGSGGIYSVHLRTSIRSSQRQDRGRWRGALDIDLRRNDEKRPVGRK